MCAPVSLLHPSGDVFGVKHPQEWHRGSSDATAITPNPSSSSMTDDRLSVLGSFHFRTQGRDVRTFISGTGETLQHVTLWVKVHGSSSSC